MGSVAYVSVKILGASSVCENLLWVAISATVEWHSKKLLSYSRICVVGVAYEWSFCYFGVYVGISNDSVKVEYLVLGKIYDYLMIAVWVGSHDIGLP